MKLLKASFLHSSAQENKCDKLISRSHFHLLYVSASKIIVHMASAQDNVPHVQAKLYQPKVYKHSSVFAIFTSRMYSIMTALLYRTIVRP